MGKGKYWHIYLADVMSGSAMISFHGKTYHMYLNGDGSLNARARELIEISYHMGATSEPKAATEYILCKFVAGGRNVLFRDYMAVDSIIRGTNLFIKSEDDKINKYYLNLEHPVVKDVILEIQTK